MESSSRIRGTPADTGRAGLRNDVCVVSSETVPARDVEIDDMILNVNGWWRVVNRREDEHGRIEFLLGKESRPYREVRRADDAVTRQTASA
jgi:hypothetical protein